jgi:serine phosphatase RsbU (regulator of sigma subunit)
MSYNKKTKEVKLASNGGYVFRQNSQRTEFIKLKRSKRFKLKSDCKFETTKIDVSNEDYLYMTTDGFIDQKGGEENFPLGKSQFVKMLEEYKNEPISNHKELFMDYFYKYKKDNERLDDVMMMSIKV